MNYKQKIPNSLTKTKGEENVKCAQNNGEGNEEDW